MIKKCIKYFVDITPALIDTIIILFFTAQPTLYYAMNFWRKAQIARMGDVIMSGDFILYSISFLSSSFLVYNQFKVKDYDWKDNLNKIIIIALLVLSGLVVMMKADDETDIYVAKWASLICILFSILIFIQAQILARRPATDVAEIRREEQETIADNLH